MLDEECKPGIAGLAPERLTPFLARLVAEQPTRGARRVLRESGLAAIGLLLAPESVASFDLKELLTEETGLLEAILDPAIRDRIRATRARTFARVLKADHWGRPQESALCAAIAPEAAWRKLKRMITCRAELSRVLPLPSISNSRSIPANGPIEIAEPPEALRDARIAIDKLPEQFGPTLLKELHRIRSTISNVRDSAPTINTLDNLIHLGESVNKRYPFNALADGALVPTDEDIERAR